MTSALRVWRGEQWVVGLLIVFGLAVSPVLAQQKRLAPLPVELVTQTFSFAELMPVSVSSNGRWIAYTVRDLRRARAIDEQTWLRTGVRDLATGTDVWIVDAETGKSRNLTRGTGDNFLPTWSPDAHFLAFLSDRDGSGCAKLWIWDSTDNSFSKPADLCVISNRLQWTPDGDKLLFTVVPAGRAISDPMRGNLAQPANGTAKVTIFKNGPAGNGQGAGRQVSSDAWDLDLMSRGLVLLDLVSRATETLVASDRIIKFELSPDGSHVAYTSAKRFEAPGSQQILFDLQVMSLMPGKSRVLASDVRLGFNGEFAWSPNGEYLAYRSYGLADTARDCHIVEVGNGVSRTVSNRGEVGRSGGNTSENVLWDPTGEYVYFVSDGVLRRASVQSPEAIEDYRVPGRQIKHMIADSDSLLWKQNGGRATIVLTHDDVGMRDGIYRVDLTTGSSTKLLENVECYDCTDRLYPFAVSKDSQHLVYFAENASTPPDLWLSDPNFAKPIRLTRLNAQFGEYEMGSVRLLDWLSDDGQRLHGVLLLPPHFQAGEKPPLIVWVYGGSRLSESFDRFGLVGTGPFNMQMLATRGYAVFLPDSPQRLGTPMLDLVKTVLPGINKVIESGFADPDRLGIIGHSNGGYGVLGLLVQTSRFKAAVEVSGMADLIASYGQMDADGSAFATSYLEHGLDGLGGTPWDVPARYTENSPIFYLDRVETPLLMVHGSNDTTVRPFLGDEIYVALRRLGKNVEYVKYADEPHSPLYWTLPSQQDFCRRVIEWFHQYLRSKD
jgi:dipeptidyl aminopeptidase/acylaminoacyl peptidase